MANKVYLSKTALTGGSAAALDYIDGLDDGNTDNHALTDGDMAYVMVSGILYTYRLDATSGATESSPSIISPDTNAGDKRWILQEARSVAVGSDADGDMYYRASSALARLAKGTADHKLFMNAGGTAPEWASGMKVIKSTRLLNAAAGDVSYSGAGFKPSAIICFAGMDATVARSQGFAAGTPPVYGDLGFNANTSVYNVNDSFFMIVYGGAGGYQAGIIKSWDADGFTATWTLSGSEAGTIKLYFLCFR